MSNEDATYERTGSRRRQRKRRCRIQMLAKGLTMGQIELLRPVNDRVLTRFELSAHERALELDVPQHLIDVYHIRDGEDSDEGKTIPAALATFNYEALSDSLESDINTSDSEWEKPEKPPSKYIYIK